MNKLSLNKETLRVLTRTEATAAAGAGNDTIPSVTGTSVNCPNTGACNVSYNLCPGHTSDCASFRYPTLCD